jgi:hypothetical protein
MKRAEPVPANCTEADRRWLTEAQAAVRLNMSLKWFQAQRLHGTGIPFARFGSAIRYAVRDIEEYERSSIRFSTSDPGSRNQGT